MNQRSSMIVNSLVWPLLFERTPISGSATTCEGAGENQKILLVLVPGIRNPALYCDPEKLKKKTLFKMYWLMGRKRL